MVSALTRGGIAIMAGRTIIHDTGMIEPGTGEGHGVMTHRAILRRGNMASGFTRC